MHVHRANVRANGVSFPLGSVLRAERPSRDTAITTMNVAPVENKKRKILVVDDSKTMLFVLRTHLTDRSLEFLEASDGETAMRCALRQQPDVIISDVQMPGMSGIELCRLVKRAPGLRSTRLVLMSSKWTRERRREVEQIGIDGILEKPVDPQRLERLISRLTQEKLP